MHTITIALFLVLANGVLCNPITYRNDDQPRLGGSLSNLPCRPLSGDYNWQIYINATQPQDSMVGNQTIFANASVVHSDATGTLIQRETLLSTATSASSMAQPTGVEEARCEILARIRRSGYRATSIGLGPIYLRSDISALYSIRIESSYPVFRVTVKGRPLDTPDIPEAYHPIYADDSGAFSLQRSLWVRISVAFASMQPKEIQCTLYQITMSDQNLVRA